MKVYVVGEDWTDNFLISSVFSTKEKAEAFIAQHRERYRDLFVIDEFVVDDNCDKPSKQRLPGGGR